MVKLKPIVLLQPGAAGVSAGKRVARPRHVKVLWGCGVCLVGSAILVWVAGATLERLLTHAMEQVDIPSAIKTTQEWSRLNNFPPSAQEISVKVTGGFFTRGFHVTFRAPLAEIEAWIDASPGTHDLSPEISNGIRRYVIVPGGGANWATVEVHEATDMVTIDTYWS